MRDDTEYMWKNLASQQERKIMSILSTPGYTLAADNVGKVIAPRHNTGLEHKGGYLHMAQVLGVVSRVPTAFCSDQPIRTAEEVSYYPNDEDKSNIKDWCVFYIARSLTEYHPAFTSCKKFVKYGFSSIINITHSFFL